MKYGFLALLVLVIATGARASGYDEFNAGISLSNREEDDAAIVHLNSALASPDLPEHLRDTALLARGGCYARQKHFDLALADYTTAAALNPKRSLSRYLRADALVGLQRYDEAVADLSQAIQLSPNLELAYMARARAYEWEGKYGEAVADIKTGENLEPDDDDFRIAMGVALWSQGDFGGATNAFDAELHDFSVPWLALWRHISALAAGQSPRLEWNSRHGDISLWPGPVVKMFLGDMTVEDMFAAAAKGNDKEIDAQKCEANFFAGEGFLLLKQDRNQAINYLRIARATCANSEAEGAAAQVELTRLGSGAR